MLKGQVQLCKKNSFWEPVFLEQAQSNFSSKVIIQEKQCLIYTRPIKKKFVLKKL